jgi:hypothetical protein
MMGISDVASSTGGYGANRTLQQFTGGLPARITDARGGYGSYVQPIDYNPYVNALPEVMQARGDLAFQGALSKQQEQQQLSQLYAAFGDPTALPGMSQGWQSLQQTLGGALDPASGAIARGNTIGPNGEIGNSTIAQLYLAGKTAMQQAVNSGIPMGAVGSSQLGYNINQQNIAAGQSLADQMSKFGTAATGYINTDAANQARLNQAVSDAVRTGTATVMKDPTSYGVPTPKTMTVGQGTPQVGDFPPGPQHPMGVPAAPTGITAAARAAGQANAGRFSPTPSINGVTPGLGSGPYQTGPGFPSRPAPPTGVAAAVRAASAANQGYIRPTPTLTTYHPNYGVG